MLNFPKYLPDNVSSSLVYLSHSSNLLRFLLFTLLHLSQNWSRNNQGIPFLSDFKSIRQAWQTNAITCQRNWERNYFEQGSYNFSCKKRRTEKAKPKCPVVFHQRPHSLTWREYVNVFLDLPQIIFFYSLVFDQVNIFSLIMLLYCQKIGEYINKDHSFQQSSDQQGESDK